MNPCRRYIFPDLSRPWPVPHLHNDDPSAAQIVSESDEWISRMHSLSAKPLYKAAFTKCNFGLLTNLSFPFACGGHLRACADWFNYTFTFDDYFENMVPEDMEREVYDVMDAMENPHDHQENDSFLTRLTREFWANVIDFAQPSDSFAKRFMSVYKDYLDAVVQEVKDKEVGYVRTVEEHIILRRNTSGCAPTFALAWLPDDIPDELMDHPDIKDLTTLATDIVDLANDLHSFNREQSGGQSHNAVSSALSERKNGYQDAIDYIYQLYEERVNLFLTKKATLPDFPHPYNELIASYIQSLQYWITGYNQWAILSGRYFDGPEKQLGKPFVVEMAPVSTASLDKWFNE